MRHPSAKNRIGHIRSATAGLTAFSDNRFVWDLSQQLKIVKRVSLLQHARVPATLCKPEQQGLRR